MGQLNTFGFGQTFQALLMRKTFYILQEVQQRGLMLLLEMIGFVRKGNDELKA